MQVHNKKPIIQKEELSKIGDTLDKQKQHSPMNNRQIIVPNKLPLQKPINIGGFREELFKLDKSKLKTFIDIVSKDEYKNPHYIKNDDMYSRLLTELMLIIKTSKKPLKSESESTFKSIYFMDQIEMYYLILGKNILDKKYQLPYVNTDLLANFREEGKLIYMYPRHRIPDQASVDYYRACLSYLRSMSRL